MIDYILNLCLSYYYYRLRSQKNCRFSDILRVLSCHNQGQFQIQVFLCPNLRILGFKNTSFEENQNQIHYYINKLMRRQQKRLIMSQNPQTPQKTRSIHQIKSRTSDKQSSKTIINSVKSSANENYTSNKNKYESSSNEDLEITENKSYFLEKFLTPNLNAKKKYINIWSTKSTNKQERLSGQRSTGFTVKALTNESNVGKVQAHKVRTNIGNAPKNNESQVQQYSPAGNWKQLENNAYQIEKQERITLDQSGPRPNCFQKSKRIILGNNLKLKKKLTVTTVKERNSSKQSTDTKGQVKDSYRYCIGCQAAIIEANIQFHQLQCQFFQQISKMSMQNIIEWTSMKIQKIKAELLGLRANLNEDDLKKAKQYFDNLIDRCEKSGQSGLGLDYRTDYCKFMQIGKKLGLFTEGVNKLNWFLQLRINLITKFDI